MKCYKGNLFIAPASYFIKNLKGQEKRKFANEVFQYDGMVCGMVEEINVDGGFVLIHPMKGIFDDED